MNNHKISKEAPKINPFEAELLAIQAIIKEMEAVNTTNYELTYDRLGLIKIFTHYTWTLRELSNAVNFDGKKSVYENRS